MKTPVSAILCLMATANCPGVVIDGFQSASNDRFANDANFIAGGLDLSGLALTDGGRWVAMVSPNVFVSAHHYAPTVGGSVTFHAGNDAAGPNVTRTISGIQRIGSSDIVVGVLDAPLGAGYEYFAIATADITDPTSFTASTYHGADAYVVGRSPTAFATSLDMAVGRNVLDTWFDDVVAGATTDDALGATIDANGEPNFVTYEADLRAGDSGAPLFVEEVAGGLTIVGINWFVSDPLGEFLGASYVGNYDAQIQSYISANAVPEPAHATLLAALCILSIAARRRRR